MSDTEITNECLTHYDSRHIQVRVDFLGLCQYNAKEYEGRRKQEPNQECMAKILRVMETLTNHEKAEWQLNVMRAKEKGLREPKEPKRYPLKITNGGIVGLIYRTFGESTVRNSLNYLEAAGYIGSEQVKKNAIPLYWLERDYVQGLLKCQAEVLLAGYEFRPPGYQGAISYPGGVTTLPERPKSNPEDANSGGAGCESTDNNIGNISDTSDEKDKEEGTGAVAPTPPLIDFSAKKAESDTAARIRAAHATSTPHAQTINDAARPDVPEWDSESMASTAKVPAVKIASVTQPEQPIRGASTGGAADAGPSPSASNESRAPGAKQAPLRLPSDEKPRMSVARQIEQEMAHYYDIVQAELPGVVFSMGQRKARNNALTIAAMIDDKLPDETLRKALKKLSAWERQNFNLKRFYEEWMPAKLATEPTPLTGRPRKDSNTLADGKTDLRYAI